MLQACASQPGLIALVAPCVLQAEINYKAVVEFGGAPYASSQENACSHYPVPACPAPPPFIPLGPPLPDFSPAPLPYSPVQ